MMGGSGVVVERSMDHEIRSSTPGRVFAHANRFQPPLGLLRISIGWLDVMNIY